MPKPAKSVATETFLVVHPGAELYGSDRMALESVVGLVESGADVVVAVPALGPLVDELQRAGARVVIIPMLVLRKALLRPRGWWALLSGIVPSWRAGRRLLRTVRPDAVYVSTITLPLWPLLARRARIPAVSHVHEAESNLPRLINRALYAPHLASRAVIVNSEFSRTILSGVLPRLGRRATVVYNGIPSPDTVPEARRELRDGVRVLYVGRLSPRKGPQDVLQAVGFLRSRGIPAQVTLLGSAFTGYEWFRTELDELVEREGLQPVTFLDFEPDIWPRLSAHDVVVAPSRADEPFGNTAAEGILAGRVVIASDTSGLREAAGGYSTTRLVPPARPDAIADAIEAVVRDWDAVRDNLAADRARALERHAPATYRSAVRSIVRGVVADD